MDARVKVVGVDALSLDEALLLARELPHLAALIDGTAAGIDAAAARGLAVAALEAAQGHPKLLELADAQAARPVELQGLLAATVGAWREGGGLPDGFLATGETTAGGDDFLQVLAVWTCTVADGLAPAGRDLFFLLCCLEEWDRIGAVLEGSWGNLRVRLARAGEPSLDLALKELAASGLIAVCLDEAGTGSFRSSSRHSGGGQGTSWPRISGSRRRNTQRVLGKRRYERDGQRHRRPGELADGQARSVSCGIPAPPTRLDPGPATASACVATRGRGQRLRRRCLRCVRSRRQ